MGDAAYGPPVALPFGQTGHLFVSEDDNVDDSDSPDQDVASLAPLPSVSTKLSTSAVSSSYNTRSKSTKAEPSSSKAKGKSRKAIEEPGRPLSELSDDDPLPPTPSRGRGGRARGRGARGSRGAASAVSHSPEVTKFRRDDTFPEAPGVSASQIRAVTRGALESFPPPVCFIILPIQVSLATNSTIPIFVAFRYVHKLHYSPVRGLWLHQVGGQLHSLSNGQASQMHFQRYASNSQRNRGNVEYRNRSICSW